MVYRLWWWHVSRRNKRIESNTGCKLKKCDQEKLSGYIETNMQYAECQNRIIYDRYMEIEYPYMDLVDLANTYRLYLAEQLDAGLISVVESQLLMKEYVQKIGAEEVSRNEVERQRRTRAWQEFGESLDQVEVKF